VLDFTSIISGFLGSLIRPFCNQLKKPFLYPVYVEDISQFETNKGYVLEIGISTLLNKVISINRNNFSIKIKIDQQLKKKMSKNNIIYGEKVLVFDNEHILKAFLDGISYGNVSLYINCHKNKTKLYLLVQVDGPGSTNPSLRFQIGKVYKSAKIKIKKFLLPITYTEVPFRHIPIIAGDNKTKIVDE